MEYDAYLGSVKKAAETEQNLEDERKQADAKELGVRALYADAMS